MHLIQQGQGDERAIVVGYLLDATIEGPKMVAALGTAPAIVLFSEGHPPETIEATIAHVEAELHCHVAKLLLVGYSLGCSGVRDVLRAHDEGRALEQLVAVVAIDGTHASLPPEDWQISIWKTQWERSIAGEIVFAASHTMQTYVEHLKPGAFSATVSVLRAATGLPLEEQGPLDAPVEHHDGQASIYSYASATIDAAAHRAQATTALPYVLRRTIRPLLEASIPPCPPTPNNAGDGGPASTPPEAA